MITNDEQFAVVKDQAARLERALESLAREVRPKNPRQFEIFAQGYVDQLTILRADMDAYLGIATVKNPEPEVEVAIEDADAALGGVIREVDLDRRLFTLRDPETGLDVERCKYNKSHDVQVRELIDHRVEVSGTRRSNGLRATRLRVKAIRALDTGGA